ncbi:MAG: HepT-like ribonuclease domain-containing protein [Bacillota bacterium]
MEITSEAAYRLSPETRENLPEIPWEDIIGMRHRLVHAYFDINLDILWQTIREDLPALVSLLSSAMSVEES